ALNASLATSAAVVPATANQISSVPQASVLVDDAYEDNDYYNTPANLGTLSGPVTLNNLVQADVDWYRFTTTSQPGASDAIAISFQNASGIIDLGLFNIAGQRLAYSNSTVANSESIS